MLGTLNSFTLCLLAASVAVASSSGVTLGNVGRFNATLTIDGNEQTLEAQDICRELRKSGTGIYFTQDAGPNLKCLFLEKDIETIKKKFPDIIITQPCKTLDEVL